MTDPSESAPDLFPAEHYEAIGRLVVACAEIDAAYIDLMSAVTGVHIFNTIIMAEHQQFANKHSTLTALFHANGIDPAKGKWIYDLLKDADCVHAFRNKVVHRYWTLPEGGEPTATRFNARGKLERQQDAFPTQTILQHAREARELAAKLDRLQDQMVASRNAHKAPDQ